MHSFHECVRWPPKVGDKEENNAQRQDEPNPGIAGANCNAAAGAVVVTTRDEQGATSPFSLQRNQVIRRNISKAEISLQASDPFYFFIITDSEVANGNHFSFLPSQGIEHRTQEHHREQIAWADKPKQIKHPGNG